MLSVDQFQDEKKVFEHRLLIQRSVFHPDEMHKIMLKKKFLIEKKKILHFKPSVDKRNVSLEP
jgi:hypothetical protein